MYICLCICVYMCIYVYMYIYIYVHTYVYTHICMYSYIHIHGGNINNRPTAVEPSNEGLISGKWPVLYANLWLVTWLCKYTPHARARVLSCSYIRKALHPWCSTHIPHQPPVLHACMPAVALPPRPELRCSRQPYAEADSHPAQEVTQLKTHAGTHMCYCLPPHCVQDCVWGWCAETVCECRCVRGAGVREGVYTYSFVMDLSGLSLYIFFSFLSFYHLDTYKYKHTHTM